MSMMMSRRTDLVGQASQNVDSEVQTPSPAKSSSEPGSQIWVPYLRIADAYDKDLVDSWRDDMEALLIFAALFSATVTGFAVASYPSLKEDPADITASILLQISQQFSNGTNSAAATRPANFRASSADVAVNICWFLSLGFSLACSLGAVMIRQWARNYYRTPRNITFIDRRARMRQYLFENLGWWRMEIVVEIPTLLHISLFFFFVGLLLFLREVNYHVALSMFCFCSVGVIAYISLTFAPVIFPGCPYSTPFSRPASDLSWSLWRASMAVAALFVLILGFARRALGKVTTVFTPHPSADSHDDGNTARTMVREFRSLCFHLFRNPSLASTHRIEQIKSFGVLQRHIATFPKRMRSSYPLKETADSMSRDSRALNWAWRLSNRDDMSGIVHAVPDFIQASGIRTGSTVVLNSHIVADIIYSGQLHNAQADQDRKTERNRYFEALHWVVRCPTRRIRDTETQSFPSPRPIPFFPSKHTLPSWIFDSLMRAAGADSFTGKAYPLIQSLYVLREIYTMEPALLEIGNGNDTVRPPIDHSIVRGCSTLCSHIRSLFPSLATDNSWYPSNANIPTVLRKLHQIRDELALLVLCESPMHLAKYGSFEDALLVRSIADALTHLKPYPDSNTRSQTATFRVMDSIIELKETRHQYDNFCNIQSSYLYVLFGHRLDRFTLPSLEHANRRLLHSDFFHYVAVNNPGDCRDENYRTLCIAYGEYCRMLEALLISLKSFPLAPGDKDHDDCHADAIVEFIQYQLPPFGAVQSVPVAVPEEHMAVVKELLTLSKCEGLHGLLLRTADGLGWGKKLRTDIDFPTAQ